MLLRGPIVQDLVYTSQVAWLLLLMPSSRQRWDWPEVLTSFLSSQCSSLESAFLQAMNTKPPAEAFATFPPSAAHFPALAVDCSLRSPDCSLFQSRQKFSLATNKKACRTGLNVAEGRTVLQHSWGLSFLSEQVYKSNTALFMFTLAVASSLLKIILGSKVCS